MEDSDTHGLLIHTAGYPEPDELHVDVQRWECGEIKDGVSFRHNDEGGWVIALDDLRKIVAAAEAVRAQPDTEG
jgi:hypothetical protein